MDTGGATGGPESFPWRGAVAAAGWRCYGSPAAAGLPWSMRGMHQQQGRLTTTGHRGALHAPATAGQLSLHGATGPSPLPHLYSLHFSISVDILRVAPAWLSCAAGRQQGRDRDSFGRAHMHAPGRGGGGVGGGVGGGGSAVAGGASGAGQVHPIPAAVQLPPDAAPLSPAVSSRARSSGCRAPQTGLGAPIRRCRQQAERGAGQEAHMGHHACSAKSSRGAASAARHGATHAEPRRGAPLHAMLAWLRGTCCPPDQPPAMKLQEGGTRARALQVAPA